MTVKHGKNKKSFLRESGYALVFAIFLVVGLETVIAGSMLNMMRLQREAQRSADEVRLSWVADACIERTVKLLFDYTLLTGAFPSRFGNGRVVLGGIDTASVNELTGGIHKDFDKFILNDWYQNKMKRNATYAGTLSDVNISQVKIVETERNNVLNSASYAITVTANKMLGGASSVPFQVEITQVVTIPINTLFDFSVFCDSDCEVNAGPDFTLQGPIFSNGNIYIMNDERASGTNTLTLKLADSFFGPSGTPNPEPYLMHAHGNTYFYFQRFVGINYLLGMSSIYTKSVSSAYKFDGVNTLEVHPGYDMTGVSGANRYPPYFYYPNNNANCLFNGNGDSCSTNQIRGQRKDGTYEWLAHSSEPLPKMRPIYTNSITDFKLYTPAYAAASRMSVSPAFDPSRLTISDMAVPRVNPNWTNYWHTTFDSTSGYSEPYMIKDGVSSKHLDLPGHSLIDPIKETDSAAVKAEKLQSKATIVLTDGPSQCPTSDEVVAIQRQCHLDLISCRSVDPLDQNLYLVCLNIYGQCFKNSTNCSGSTASPQFIEFINKGILKQASVPDIRENDDIGDYTLDIAKMMADPTVHLGPKPLVYFSVQPFSVLQTADKPELMLINGAKLPREGLTVATDGRLWIQSDPNTGGANGGGYNTFDYAKNRHCTEAEWDAQSNINEGQCRVPPAAIFSDSIGVMTKNMDGSLALDSRLANSNVMINTAIATGYLPSMFKRNGSYNEANCNDKGIKQGSCLWASSGTRILAPQGDGTLLTLGVPYSVDDYTFSCPDRSYKLGRDGVTSQCEYYRESDDIYHYYVNPKSTMYQSTLSTLHIEPTVGFGALQGCNPNANPDSAAGCNKVRIPIFADPSTIYFVPNPTAAPPFPGVYFAVLDRFLLAGGTANTCTQWQPQSECVDGSDPFYQSCGAPGTGEETDTNGDVRRCSGCQIPRSTSVCLNWVPVHKDPVKVAYMSFEHFKLYDVTYSGGVENLINLQEDWRGKTFRFLGMLAMPWTAQHLSQPYGTGYYRAPIRKFDYNEDLRINRPPGTPDISSIKRRRWSRKF